MAVDGDLACGACGATRDQGTKAMQRGGGRLERGTKARLSGDGAIGHDNSDGRVVGTCFFAFQCCVVYALWSIMPFCWSIMPYVGP